MLSESTITLTLFRYQSEGNSSGVLLRHGLNTMTLCDASDSGEKDWKRINAFITVSLVMFA